MDSTQRRPCPPGTTPCNSGTVALFILIPLFFSVLYSSDRLPFRRPDCPIRLQQTPGPPPANLSSAVPRHHAPPPPPPGDPNSPRTTRLGHLVFGIAASSDLWEERKEYIKLWWQPGEIRGVVWVDRPVAAAPGDALPEIRVSSDTSALGYSNRRGKRSALRISRVVSETLRLGLPEVRWFVMGDDDTVFVAENVARVLSKYDHRQFYYVGSSSESHVQNIYFSSSMAYGGGGFAISYPLAAALEKIQDRCMDRYPGLYGSDDRIQACMAELGVPLTREPGFHQYDVYGDLLGLLGSHPVTPLTSLHHLDVVAPIFPGMRRAPAVAHLLRSARHDAASLMQQSICHHRRLNWSISVAWGYAVQVIRGGVAARELETPARTFVNWYPRSDYTAHAFNTRPLAADPCQHPFVFYVSNVTFDPLANRTVGVYFRRGDRHPVCRWKMVSPQRIHSVVVLKTPDARRWEKSPRRDCCRVLPSENRSSTLYIGVGNCDEGEISEM